MIYFIYKIMKYSCFCTESDLRDDGRVIEVKSGFDHRKIVAV